MPDIELHILDTPEELKAVEDLQRMIWPGDETEIVPVHMFRACVHNGGLVIGAYLGENLVGFVFGFPGFDFIRSKVRLIHASHMAGVHPGFRNAGIGYKLKRAQWQMVRKQGVERITWTYDPLQSRNANLNIAKLGAVCNVYIPNYYGEMRDEVNFGLPSDRFQVDWWVNSNRVKLRLDKKNQFRLSPSRYLEAGIPFINHTVINEKGLISPQSKNTFSGNPVMLLLEIPAEIQTIKLHDMELAVNWVHHIRELFVDLFHRGYLTTDFVYVPGEPPRAFYVLTYGEATF